MFINNSCNTTGGDNMMYSTAVVLLCCFFEALAWSVSVAHSTVHCHVGDSATAGNSFRCDIQLRDDAGILVGDEGEICNFGSNLTHTQHVDSNSNDHCGSLPFSWSDSSGLFSLEVTPQIAGPFEGSIFYDSVVLGEVNIVIYPTVEDISKITSSCAVVNSLTECTTTHRDRFNNPTKTCFQRWGSTESEGTSECSVVLYSSSSF